MFASRLAFHSTDFSVQPTSAAPESANTIVKRLGSLNLEKNQRWLAIDAGASALNSPAVQASSRSVVSASDHPSHASFPLALRRTQKKHATISSAAGSPM